MAKLTGAVSGNFTGPAFIGHDHELVTRLRHLGEALDFHRNGGARRFDRLAVFVEHGADTAKSLTRQHHVANMEGSRLNQDSGHWTTPFVELGFNHQTLGHGIDGRLEFQNFGLEQHLFEQLINAFTGFGRDRHKG